MCGVDVVEAAAGVIECESGGEGEEGEDMEDEFHGECIEGWHWASRPFWGACCVQGGAILDRTSKDIY